MFYFRLWRGTAVSVLTPVARSGEHVQHEELKTRELKWNTITLQIFYIFFPAGNNEFKTVKDILTLYLTNGTGMSEHSTAS